MATGILQLIFDHNTSPVTTSDVTALLWPVGHGQPVTFSKIVNQRWTCRFTLKEPDTGYTGANRPAVGQAFRLLEDGVLLFSGFIDTIEEMSIESTRVNYYHCSCSNWATITDRRVVKKTYQQNTLASLVIADIVATALAGEGITTNNVVVSGALTAPIALEPILVSQAFDTIRDMVNAQWWVDENKDLHFIAVGSGATLGWSLTVPSDASRTEWNDGTMKITRTTKDYRNVQYVSSSALGQPPPQNSSSSPLPQASQYTTLIDTYVTTGSAYDFWVLTSQAVQLDPTNPVPPTLTIDGVSQTIKQYFKDPAGQAAWYWGPDTIGMQQGQQIAPAAGKKIIITYQAFAGGGGTIAPASGGGSNTAVATQNWVVQSNAGEIASRSAFEGDSGNYEQVTSVPGISDPTVANALASGLLARSDTIPDIITYDTWRTGYVVGAKLSVVIPYHGLNATYTVMQIDGREELAAQGPISSKMMVYTITLSNQQDIGLFTKWFEGLIRTIGAGTGGGGGAQASVSSAASPGLQVIREMPSGTKNGVDSPASGNLVFTLSFTPQPPWAVWLFLNGVYQNALGGSPDYTLSGNTITMTVAPRSTDLFECIYFIANAGLAPQVVQPTVYSTGPFQHQGDIDPHWQLTLSADPGATAPGLMYVISDAEIAANPTWVTAPVNTRWIGVRGGGTAAAGSYKTVLNFNWPTLTGTITGFAAADNSFTLKFNGATVIAISDPAYLALHAFSITTGFLQGTNTLEMDWTEDGAGGAGILVQITQATTP
jgi:hypothetical protein